ncbi:MAG TPA: hypothetical protein VF412_02915 [Bdellovibrio sp.]|uniref:hypothetical protein n=1 Tax=Bdellovibrio sp. TaxID=28201 RepID=UPI002F1D2F96
MNNRGQIVVEYVLLLVLAVALATLLAKQLVSRDVDNGGILTVKWHKIMVAIGADIPDSNQ